MKSTTDHPLLNQTISSRRQEILAEVKYLKAAVSEIEKLIRYKEERLKVLDDLEDETAPSLSLTGNTPTANSEDKDLKHLKTPEKKKKEFLYCVDSTGKNNIYVDDRVRLTPSKKGKFKGITTGKVVGLYLGRERVLSIEVQLEVPVSPTETKKITQYTWRESKSVTVEDD